MSQQLEQPWQVVAKLNRDAVTYYAAARLGEFDLGRGYSIPAGTRVTVDYRPNHPANVGGPLIGLHVRPDMPSGLCTFVRRADGKQLTAAQLRAVHTYSGLAAAPLFTAENLAAARETLVLSIESVHRSAVVQLERETASAIAAVRSAQ